jgi:hypothetical protein
LGWLCATGRMRMCGYFFSRVGHTHCALGR